MKVIFLDVDGVLANSRAIRSQKSQQDRPHQDDPALIYDPLRCQRPLERRCVEELARLVAMTGADGVVLTTMWRHYADKRKFLTDSLRAQGIPVLGDTPGGQGRADEIKRWLVKNSNGSPNSFVILDDQHGDLFEKKGFGNYLVKTVLNDPENHIHEGLTREKTDEAITIMGNQEFSHWMKHNKLKITQHYADASPTLQRQSSTGIGVQFEI